MTTRTDGGQALSARVFLPPRESSLTYAVSRIIRLGVGCIFLLGGISKLQNPYTFLATLDQYEIFGSRVAVAVTVALPFLEITVAACLLVGAAPRAAWAAAILLLTGFSLALASVAYRGLHTTCGCFGPLEQSDVTWATFYRSAGLLGLTFLGMRWNLAPPGPRTITPL